jgi:hypothetical protein
VTAFVVVLILGAVFVGAAWGLVWRLAPDRYRGPGRRWLTVWSLKGLLVPLALWAVMNLGISWELQPFMPQVQAAQNGGGRWFPVFLRVAANGVFIVCSYWMAATLAWAVVRAGLATEGDSRRNFKALCWTGFLGMIVPALIIMMIGGWPSLGLAAGAILVPIAGYAPGMLRPKKLPPMYARAVARMKFGKYTEAEWEIIHELEKSEDDFEGWMMLAELYANHFHDMNEAEQTILGICDHASTSPSQLAVALHRLADWHVKHAGDPEAARRALEMICSRLPGTHLAHMAGLRINQLPATAEALREQQSHKPIPLPGAAARRVQGPFDTSSNRTEATAQAGACVAQLERDPNDVAAREKLAGILAERLEQAEAGIEQLRQLLMLPGQQDAKRAEWLRLMAAWQIHRLNDPEEGRKTLERLVREFPLTPQALAAQGRIQRLKDGSRQGPPG